MSDTKKLAITRVIYAYITLGGDKIYVDVDNSDLPCVRLSLKSKSYTINIESDFDVCNKMPDSTVLLMFAIDDGLKAYCMCLYKEVDDVTTPVVIKECAYQFKSFVNDVGQTYKLSGGKVLFNDIPLSITSCVPNDRDVSMVGFGWLPASNIDYSTIKAITPSLDRIYCSMCIENSIYLICLYEKVYIK
jgi:hypothetical protein